MNHLGELFDELARRHGERRLVEQPGGRTLTYCEAADLVSRWSSLVTPGDTVVVALPNGYDQLLACVAVARGGGIPVPVNDRMGPEEIEHVVANSGATTVWRDVTGGEPVEPREPATMAAIFYTSGTTGLPKGARLSHEALVGPLRRARWFPNRLRRDEAVIALPVAHIMGWVVLTGLAAVGVPVYVMPRFDAPAALDAIERRRATVFVGVPAMYRMLLAAGAADRDLKSIRVWGSGADAMPGDLARAFQGFGATARVVGVDVGEALFVEGWGMVETGGAAIGRIALPYVGGPSWPVPGYRVKVAEDGELLVKSPGVLEGYHGDPAATAAALDDGWLRTGDLVTRGRLGSVSFAGRKKDVIKSGGFSVFAAEVERVLEEHDGVVEAAVLGVDDARLGQVPVAVVRGDADTEALMAFVRERLAPYKVPRRIVVSADELPRGGTGKIQKDRLRAQVVGDSRRRSGL